MPRVLQGQLARLQEASLTAVGSQGQMASPTGPVANGETPGYCHFESLEAAAVIIGKALLEQGASAASRKSKNLIQELVWQR